MKIFLKLKTIKCLNFTTFHKIFNTFETNKNEDNKCADNFWLASQLEFIAGAVDQKMSWIYIEIINFQSLHAYCRIDLTDEREVNGNDKCSM